MCAPDAFVSRGNFRKRNFNNVDVFVTANNDKKIESPTTFFLCIDKCPLDGSVEEFIKNCCLVAGFVDLSKAQGRGVDTENLP